MRNKSAFTKPVVQNAFKKSSRSYPQPKKLERNTINNRIQEEIMEEQPQYKQLKKIVYKQHQHHSAKQIKHVTTALTNNSFMPLNLNGRQQCVNRFHFVAQYPTTITGTHGDQNVVDPTCLWYHTVQNAIFKNNKRSICFLRMDFVVSKWVGDLFPSIIYITIDGMMGYCDRNAKATDRMVGLQLSQVSPLIDDAAMRTYDLRYVFQNSLQWQLPHELTCLKFRLKYDDQQDYIQLPTQNPLSLHFQIRNK